MKKTKQTKTYKFNPVIGGMLKLYSRLYILSHQISKASTYSTYLHVWIRAFLKNTQLNKNLDTTLIFFWSSTK